jgi:hypothetical protein
MMGVFEGLYNNIYNLNFVAIKGVIKHLSGGVCGMAAALMLLTGRLLTILFFCKQDNFAAYGGK